MERVPHDEVTAATRVDRDEVQEGETYIYEWSPYGWASQNEGYEGRVRVTVTDTGGIVRDIKMRTDDGTTLTDLGEGRAQVMGSAENTDSVPDYTDVGRGGRFYEVPNQGEKDAGASGLRSGEGSMGPLPGGWADRESNDY